MSAKLAISRPKIGASGKTGSWRTFRPIVKKETCTDCGNCGRYCPDGAVNAKNEIDYDFCKGCGICAQVCPKKCIEMVREE